MALNEILLNGVELSPYGRKFSEAIVEISSQDRTISGRLVKDILATKKQFTLEYSIIDDATLTQLITAYNTLTEATLSIAYRTGETVVYTVLMQPIEYTRKNIEPQQLWEGVSVVFEEV